MNLFTRAREIAGDVARGAGEAVGDVADAMRPQRPVSIGQVARSFAPGAAAGAAMGAMARRSAHPMLPMREMARPMQPRAPYGEQVANTHMYGLDDAGNEHYQSPEYPGNFVETAPVQRPYALEQASPWSVQPALGVGALDYNGRLRVR